MTRKVILVLAALLIVWGAVDLYHYFAIGRDMLQHYAGVGSVEELVRYNLIQGSIKTALGLLLAALCFLVGGKKRRS